MRKADIYELGVKLFGIYLLFKVFDLTREVLSYLVILVKGSELMKDPAQTGIFWVSVLNLAIVAMVCYLFVFRTRAVAKRICNAADYEESAKLSAERRTIYEIALTLMGLVVIVWFLPDLCVKLKYLATPKPMGMPWITNDLDSLAALVVKVVVAFLAIRYSRTIAGYLAKDGKQ
jgi:hypothetical protein